MFVEYEQQGTTTFTQPALRFPDESLSFLGPLKFILKMQPPPCYPFSPLDDLLEKVMRLEDENELLLSIVEKQANMLAKLEKST